MRTALLLAVLLPMSLWAASYELADLKALDKDKSWRELVDHLNDIPPSKRDAEWKAIAERACAGVLDTLEIKDVYTGQAALDQIDDLMKRYGWLKDSKVFLAKRAEVGFKAFGWTFSGSRHSTGDDPWLDKLKAFVAADTVTPDLALRGAKVVTKRLVPIVAFPLLKTALAKGGKEVCKDTDLQKATLEALIEGSWKTEATEVATTCWDQLKPLLTAEVLKADATRTVQLKLCPTLIEKNALSAEQKKKACTFD